MGSKKLVKDGIVILDGTEKLCDRERRIFLEYEKYKDIEEELGINLIIFFGALKYGVYYFTGQHQAFGQISKDSVSLINKYLCGGRLGYHFITGFEKKILFFEDYGKTWALTAEELNDNENEGSL